ncbi:hypothetical protein QBC36DRAFT_58418 [Triangularia setosa]|uniref:Uncharacterized protein n=1 Tax=Triangularia setosa TaxID=2587417 RepID=A0AAN7A446_9PEZI|nr:hypothetical protein QBC36DRAFT_58418 [Podospora setosa]
MRRPTTIDFSSNPLMLFFRNGLQLTSTPQPAQSTSQQHEEAPKTIPPPGETLAPSPVNRYDPVEYYRGRTFWTQCAKPDLLQFFADFEEFREGCHDFAPGEVHEAILDTLKSAKQRPKDAQRFIPEDSRNIIDNRRALPDCQWAVVDVALYLGKCCFEERSVASAQITFQPADLKKIKFRKAVMLMAISGIRDMGPWLLEQKKMEQK